MCVLVRVLVSACLLGKNCKYNGGNNLDERVIAFLKDKEVIAVCPEESLGVPRIPMEIVDGVLLNKEGVNIDSQVRENIEKIMQQLKQNPVDLGILKSRSPTCGVKQVYDGSFTGKLIDGAGVLTQALQAAGVTTVDAEDL